MSTTEAQGDLFPDAKTPEDVCFTVKPARSADAHRPLGSYDLKAILSGQETRTVDNDYTLRYAGQRYQIERCEITVGLRRSKVIVEERLDGGLKLRWRGRVSASQRNRQTGGRPEADPTSCNSGRATPSLRCSSSQSRNPCTKASLEKADTSTLP